MRFVICMIFLLTKFSDSTAQNLMKEYVANSFNPIKAADSNFSKFEPLAKSIGDSRIVMLGEQDHGDGSTFSVKSELVQFLHEKMGFNVLAFESDFYSLNQGWSNTQVKDSSHLDTLINQNVFTVWTKCAQCKSVFQYLKTKLNTKDKLELTGFDNQLSGVYGYHNFRKDIFSFLDTTKIAFIKNIPKKETLYTNMNLVLYFFREKQATAVKIDILDHVVQDLDSISDQLSKYYDRDNFYFISIRNFKSYCQELSFALKKGRYMSDSARDKQMAENLLWLVTKKYPKEKIIVWAANSHIFKNKDDNLNKKYPSPYSMGCLFTSSGGFFDKTYIIGFTGYEGLSQRIISSTKTKLSKPNKNGLEQWMSEKGFDQGFLDFKSFRIANLDYNEPFYMRRTNSLSIKALWADMYDGIYYIKTTEPCK